MNSLASHGWINYISCTLDFFGLRLYVSVMMLGHFPELNLSIYLSLLSRSISDHHLRCGGWLNLEFSKREKHVEPVVY